MATQLENALTALGFARAPNDAVRARLLLSIAQFADDIGDQDLADTARGCLPAVSPFKPPANWHKGFCDGFRFQGDPDSGVDPDDGHNQGLMLWQMSSDAWRSLRGVDSERQGFADGEAEALAQNEVV